MIAFRIIAGFLTAPLLRLSGIWQSVQETQISLERVNKIIDYESENANYSSFVKGDPRKVLGEILNLVILPNKVYFMMCRHSSVLVPPQLCGQECSGKTTLINYFRLHLG